MKIAPSTWGLALAAVASVVLVHADPWGDAVGGGFVSTRSAAKRVFPRAADVSPEGAEIVVRPAAGEVTRLVPSADGHDVVVDDVAVGPADPEAVEGLWASLRMATTLRAVSDAIDIGPARRGEIAIAFGDERYSVVVGAPTPDGVGLYGGIGDELWVVEDELGLILDQQPQAWLARRAVVVEVGQLTKVSFADATLERGEDGRWRSTVGDRVAILSTDSVEAKLERLVSARLDPLLPGHDGEGDVWVGLEAVGDRAWTLRRDGACPGGQGREVVRRGPGWAGCVDDAVVEPWVLPGRLVEPRLLPHPHARVLRIEMTAPTTRALARKGGDWVLTEDAGATELPGAEVFRWYTTLHDAEVEARLDDPLPETWDVEMKLTMDSTQVLELRCVVGNETVCQRDRGPLLAVRTDDVVLAFARDTFVDRQLFAFSTEDARAIEITGPDVQRQSVHFDMGVWRLDAPEHPDGDDALSEIRLEDMLAAVAGARAQEWVTFPSDDALRTIRVELTPSRQRASEHTLALHEDCVAVAGERAARLSAANCRRLGRELLHDDALKFWIETARSVEVTEGGKTIRFTRAAESLVTDDPNSDDARTRLTTLSTLRATAIRPGVPNGKQLGTLRVLPKAGAAFNVVYSESWAQIEDAAWHYVLAAPPEP